jgi:cysteine synthase B
MKVFQHILDAVGNTPLVKSRSIVNKKGVTLYFKLEGDNPGGSVKDRAAKNMILNALERKDIKKGDTIIEATSGNTGIALALIANQVGINMKIIMPENATIERVKTMRAYGAEVILTKAEKGIEGARDLAEELANNHSYFQLNQFANDDNWKAHLKTTGPEIWKDTEGKVTHFVSAMGTTGTIMGVSSYLKSKNEHVQIIGAQPTDGSSIPGIRKWPEAYLPKIFDRSKVDRILEVSELEATEMARRLAREEGILGGMSSGGAAVVANRIAQELEEGIIVAIVCDRGDRYLSSALYE